MRAKRETQDEKVRKKDQVRTATRRTREERHGLEGRKQEDK